jgi:phospholipase/lecithinase/hemolysin
MKTVNGLEFTAQSNITCKVLLSITAIVMAMTIGSTSLRAACHLEETAATLRDGVKLQVIAFGDSLLDVGTYQQFAKANFDGGEFTTNPSTIFVQNLACTYGDLLLPAFQGGFGRPLAPSGGFDYAQGGSRVSMQPGINHAASGTPNADFSRQTTIPVADQLNTYLSVNRRFHSNQLVVINGGANDVFFNLEVAQRAGTTAALQAAEQAIAQSASDLANVVDVAIAKGATHVVLLNVPDLGTTPQGFVSADHGQSLTQISQLFNSTLQGALQSKNLLDKVVLIDAFSLVDNIVIHFQDFGFKVSNTAMACNLQAQIEKATTLKLDNPTQFAESLFCSPATFTTKDADESFMFADTVHPTTHLSAVISKAVEQQVKSSGLVFQTDRDR